MSERVDLRKISNVREEFSYGKRPSRPEDLRAEIVAELKKDCGFALVTQAELLKLATGLTDQPTLGLHFAITRWRWQRFSPAPSKPETFAALSAKHGLISLQHSTSLKNLIGIIKAQMILSDSSKNSVFGGGIAREIAAYLAAKSDWTRGAWIEDLERDGALIEFSPDILDAYEWAYATPRPAHGHEKDDSLTRDRSFEIFAIMVGNNLGEGNRRESYNEVVSFNNIPLVHVRQIYVNDAVARGKVMMALAASGLQAGGGRSWDQVVVIPPR